MPLKNGVLLLAGEGPFLRIYDHDSLTCLSSARIFDSQYIHGVIYSIVFNESSGDESYTLVFLWGGYSICLLRMDHLTGDIQSKIRIKRIYFSVETEDRILAASFADTGRNAVAKFHHIFLVSIHNCLYSLRFPVLSKLDCVTDWRFCQLTAGPKSMLYSAHLVRSSKGRMLVAAGTVFGEVFLWSFQYDAIELTSEFTVPSFLHYTFHGHDGSVFGVRISEEPTDPLSSPAGRVLASCGDDRTIRVWDISNVDQEQATERFNQGVKNGSSHNQSHIISSLPIATAMGHTSRIWGLRFLRHTEDGSLLLSFGEDATSQVWYLGNQSKIVESGQVGDAWDTRLQHHCTFEYHAKRNTWSATTHVGTDGNFTISTGGADGRIVSFILHKHGGFSHTGKCLTTQWTMSSILDQLKYNEETPICKQFTEAEPYVKILPENVFTALEGNWTVNRRLESEICTYPSGIFLGTASFEMRPPTDPAYDAEYLYVEKGQFSTEQGLNFSATRRYAYRFQKSTNHISAWFVNADDDSSVDYLFHDVNIKSCTQESILQMSERKRCLLEADGHHLCIDDDYQANYIFNFHTVKCDEWELKYIVKGPRKAYSTNAQYVRDDSQRNAKNEVELENIIESNMSLGEVERAGIRKAVSDVGSFSTYTWVGDDQLLVSTTKGHLLLGDMSPVRDMATNHTKREAIWRKVGPLAHPESPCLATSIQDPAIAVFAGREGSIFFCQHPKDSIKSQIQLPAKPSYLKFHLLVRCPNGTCDQRSRKAKLWIIGSCLRPLSGYAFHVNVDLETSSFSVSSSFALTLLPNFIVTSSCFTDTGDMLVLGSRGGSLAIYEHLAESTDDVDVAPSLMLHGIHGKDAVTAIENVPRTSSASGVMIYILTASRDGTYSIHLITAEDLRSRDMSIGFQTVHVCKPFLGFNIEGACFNRTTEELWLWGFSSKDFVVWNESRKARVMTVECGGAHRNWAFLPGHGEDPGGQLAWTKASSCRVFLQPKASHQVLQHGGHGREIKAAAISPLIELLDGRTARFVATGAEDTAIRIFHASKSTHTAQRGHHGLRCVGVFSKHTSGLQQLRWSPNGQLLFSAAGCEEFFVWRIRPAPCVEVGIVCEAVCPPVTESADLRIMGFDVMEIGSQDDDWVGDSPICQYLLSMVYSDSTMRVRKGVLTLQRA